MGLLLRFVNSVSGKSETVKLIILQQQWETGLFYSEGERGLTEPFTLRRSTDGLLTYLSVTLGVATFTKNKGIYVSEKHFRKD